MHEHDRRLSPSPAWPTIPQLRYNMCANTRIRLRELVWIIVDCSPSFFFPFSLSPPPSFVLIPFSTPNQLLCLESVQEASEFDFSMSEPLQMVQVGICGGISSNCTMQTNVCVMHVYGPACLLCEQWALNASAAAAAVAKNQTKHRTSLQFAEKKNR